MSFDEAFNYEDAKVYLSDKIAVIDDELTIIDDELTIIGNLSDVYQPICINRVTHLNDKKQALLVSKSRLNDVISNIVTVETLPVEHKNVLYDFYTTFIQPENLETQRDYMRRILHNSSDIVAVANNLLTDSNISAQEAACIVGLIRDTYPIERDTFSLVHSLQ